MNLAPMIKFREVDNTGAPLSGGLVYTAQPGTVAGPSQSYPKVTYSDPQGIAANTNPVVLDSSGRASIWLLGAYSIAVYDTNGSLIQSERDYSVGGATASSVATEMVFGDATDAAFNVNILAAEDTSAPDVYEVSKVDGSANPVVIIPATGTVLGDASFSLVAQGESIRLKKYVAGNDWMRG